MATQDTKVTPQATPTAPNRTTPPRRRAPRTGERGRGFTAKEVDDLLTVMEEIIPVGGEDWRLVSDKHNETWGFMKRKEDGLRRKFAKLYTSGPPTGNPNIPVANRAAKYIRSKIVEKADMECDQVGNLGMSDDETEFPFESFSTPQDLPSQVPSPPVLNANAPPSLGPRPIIRKRQSQPTQSNTGEAVEMMRLQLLEDAKRYEEDRKERREMWEMERRDRMEMEKTRIEREERDRRERIDRYDLEQKERRNQEERYQKERMDREDARSKEMMLLLAAITNNVKKA